MNMDYTWTIFISLMALSRVNCEECQVASPSANAAIKMIYDIAVPEMRLQLVDQGDDNPREIPLMDHSLAEPAVRIGKGRTTFIEYRGNFNVSDYTADKISLPFIEVEVDYVTTGMLGRETNAMCKSIVFKNFKNISTPSEMVSGVAMVNMTFGNVGQSVDEEQLQLVIGDRTVGYDRVWVRFSSTANERIYGGGEQFSFLNMKGRPFPIWTREQGVGRNKATNMTFLADTQDGGAGGDYHTTYWPEPLYYSDQLYSVVMTSSKYSVFDFTQDDFTEIEVWEDKEFQFDIHVGSNWEDIVAKTSTYLLAGLSKPQVPEWSYKRGAILGLQGGTDVVMEIYDRAVANDVKVSGIWIQDWVGQIKTSFGTRLFWDWKLDETRYPRIREIMAEKEQEGVYFTAYINPYLNDLGDLYKEASSKGYLVKAKDGSDHVSDFGEFDCGTVDLTNPAAYEWYKNVIKVNMIDVGFRGWMADFGEYMPIDDQIFYDGRTAEELHNLWPSMWAQANREAIQERQMEGKIFVWMRAGHTDSPKHVISGWAGDQNVDWSWDDGLVSTIPAALSLGMSGVGVTHYDIGGFTSLYGVTRDQELLLRSAELAVFTPTMRTHEGNRPTENFQIYTDDYTLKRFGRLTRIHEAIGNYTESVIQEYYATNVPAQRPMFFECPDDVECYDETVAKTQFMYGADLIVSPQYEQGETMVKTYLPVGQWVNVWNSMSFEVASAGRYVTTEARVGEPPIFFRQSSNYESIFLSLRDDRAKDYPPDAGIQTTATISTLIVSLALALWYNNSL